MLQLFLISFALMGVSIGIAFLCKKYIKSEKCIFILFLVASLLTVLIHYSSLLFHLIKDGECLSYLVTNSNLVLPLYPCNVVMYTCVIFGSIKNKNSAFTRYLADFCTFFGIASATLGMLINVDFVRNPNLGDYDITKGIIAHGAMFFNVILIPMFGYTKINLQKNLHRFGVSAIMMGVVGLLDSAILLAFKDKDFLNMVNPMFMIHTPFEGAPFLVYPFIAVVAILIVFILLIILEAIIHRKDPENIWFRRNRKAKID